MLVRAKKTLAVAETTARVGPETNHLHRQLPVMHEPYLVPTDLLLDFGSLGTDGLRVGQFLLRHRQPVRHGLCGFVELLCQDQDVLQLLLPIVRTQSTTKEQLPVGARHEKQLQGMGRGNRSSPVQGQLQNQLFPAAVPLGSSSPPGECSRKPPPPLHCFLFRSYCYLRDPLTCSACGRALGVSELLSFCSLTARHRDKS